MVNDKACPQCGAPMRHFTGTSKKTGKPYAMWKCGGCSFVEWLKATGYPKPPTKQDDERVLQGLRAIYGVLIEIRDLLKKDGK